MKGNVSGERVIGDGSQDKEEDKVAAYDGQCAIVDEDIEIS